MIPFRKLLSRIDSISTPIGGISWDSDKSEQDIALDLILFLEDRRILYSPFEQESHGWVIDSVLQTREKLSSVLSNDNLDNSSILNSSCVAMRAACRCFLDKATQKHGRPVQTGFESVLALGELRAQLGMSILRISYTYKIDLPEILEGILPPQPTNEDREINKN